MSKVINHIVTISKTTDRTVVDENTGVLSTEPALDRIEYITPEFSEYAQLYYGFYNIVNKCNLNLADRAVLVEICIRTDSNGIIWLTKNSKSEISKMLGIHLGTVNNAIVKLCKVPELKPGQVIGVDHLGPILMRSERSSYKVNPLLVHKGAISRRVELVSNFQLRYKKVVDDAAHTNLI